MDFLEIDISRDPQGSNIQSALREITGGSTASIFLYHFEHYNMIW